MSATTGAAGVESARGWVVVGAAFVAMFTVFGIAYSFGAFFGPMALSALEALAPLDAHRRYDMGLVALVTGNASMAAAQADTILRQRPTHLLGLALAARAADARGDAVARRDFRRRLVAAEPAERTRSLAEYADHDADIRAAVTSARQP